MFQTICLLKNALHIALKVAWPNTIKTINISFLWNMLARNVEKFGWKLLATVGDKV